jgi:hypothetical protein
VTTGSTVPQERRDRIAEGVRRHRKTNTVPNLPRRHGLSREAVAEWRGWWTEGYAAAWSDPQIATAIELLHLIDDLRRLEHSDPALRLRLTRQVHSERDELGLLKPSPVAEHRRREAQAEQLQRDYLQTPAYAAMTDAELRRQGFPEHLIAERAQPALTTTTED